MYYTYHIVLIAILITVFSLVVYSYRGFFQLNDVTTTPDDPPQFQKIKHLIGERSIEFTPEAAYLNKQHYGKLQPLRLEMTPEEAFKRVQEAARQMPDWEIIDEDSAAKRLEAVATTSFMEYRDDVVIEVRPEGSDAASIHMRSTSRIGRGDFGTNARRIRHFLNAVIRVKSPQ